MKKLLLITVLFMLVASLVISGCASTAPAPSVPTTPATPTTPSAPAKPAPSAPSPAPPPVVIQRPPTPTTPATPTTPTVPRPVPAPAPAIPGAPSPTIGLATGGAKDIANFRENIENNYLPLPTDITYEGLFYDYYFDTGQREACQQLYCPSYSYAVTRDPFSGKTEYYLSVGLNSGMKESDFQRKNLNLVIVLDISGSMGEYFNRYYYDRFGNTVDIGADVDITSQKKIDSARESVLAILDQLNADDRFAIVLFNSRATLAKPMSPVSRTNMSTIKDQVRRINAGGSTNLEAGMLMATGLFRDVDIEGWDYENRIIILTDAQPNTGDTSEQGFMGMTRNNAASRIYSTFIGIGVDFNTELIDSITKIKGANYYSVHSPVEFRKRMEEEFDYMVTPLVFDLRLTLDSRGWQIEKVFGSPEADQATGELMKINTLFPSKKVAGQTRGGVVLLKLRKVTSLLGDDDINLRVAYEDRDGRRDSSYTTINLTRETPEFFENSGIRKAVLLSRYAALLKDWLIDERQYAHYSRPWDPSIDDTTGIAVPPDIPLGQWERQSLPLMVSEPYKRWFQQFYTYLENEMYAVNDDTLSQELDILDYLVRFR
jgi:Ca-activated chloride channel family protein